MNTIPAQEIKQRGISAVDPLLERGPVHVISRNRPKYVIMDEARYEELMEVVQEARHWAFVAEVQQSLAEIEAGNTVQFASVDELMDAIDRAGDEA